MYSKLNIAGLIASRAGKYKFTLDLIAKVTRGETWNQISFKGPAAGIAAVTANSARGQPQPGLPGRDRLRAKSCFAQCAETGHHPARGAED